MAEKDLRAIHSHGGGQQQERQIQFRRDRKTESGKRDHGKQQQEQIVPGPSMPHDVKEKEQ